MDISNKEKTRKLSTVIDNINKDIANLERTTPQVVNVPTISTVDMAEIIAMPEGYDFRAIDNDGKLYDCKIQNDKLFYSPNNYTEL